MDTIDCIRKRRTIRFFEQRPVSHEILLELVDLARISPSGANRQPLEYIIVEDTAQKERLFEQLAWAGHVQPKRNPPANKRPAAYIIVLVNTDISSDNLGSVDAAAAIQTILLAAYAHGIGSCWLGSIRRDNIRKHFKIPDLYGVDSVVALGYPSEHPCSEDAKDGSSESLKYYLDTDDQLHVPKRALSTICYLDTFGKKA